MAAVIYRGKEFRRQHGVTQREIAEGTRMREATLVDLEHGKHAPYPETLARIITYFRSRNIPCDIGDLLVYEEEVPPHD